MKRLESGCILPAIAFSALASIKAATSGVAAKAATTASSVGGGCGAVCLSLAFLSTAAPVKSAFKMPWSSKSWFRAAADARMPE